MASSSSSSSLVSSGGNFSRYDVFLSFRGEDTRDSFTDHLYAALVRAGLLTFRDDDELDKGEDLRPEIERAITLSRASIVVLSEHYANSTWCLDELLFILKQRRNFNHFVLPVFYHVDPSDVRKQQKSFAIKVNSTGVEGSQTSAKWTEHNVDQWKAALTEVANLTAMIVSGSETKFITDIVNTIGRKLHLKLVSTSPHLTGMDARARYINSWLRSNHNDKVLAVCGMGGSGKTTLAKYIFDSNSQKFENSSFLEDIGRSCEQPHGLVELRKQLLMDIEGVNYKTMPNVTCSTSDIERALQTRRVLIVLDDIEKQDQIEALLGRGNIKIGSKIIITTRVLDTQAWFQSINQSCREYAIQLLDDDESLELLSCYAFGSKIPMIGFEELTLQVAQYCAGNPLALKVLGSSLFVSAKDPQKRNKIKSWISTLNLLKKDAHSEIQGILRRSFESLPYSSCKELFLHIACFFIGEDEDYVVKILEPDYSAAAGIRTLINRCLLTISPRNKLMMHGLLREMGRKIICEESPKVPEKRSRVWCNQESFALLRKGKGSETMEGLALDMKILRKEKHTLKPPDLTTDSLTKMDKLKLLQLRYVQLEGSYVDFPENLRWLCWHGFRLRIIPFYLFLGTLVAIDMSYSYLKKFDPPVVLESLKILNLKDSHKLLEIRNISRLPNLETLILWNCSSLVHVCGTIGDLKSLTLLNMMGCENMWKLSTKSKYVNPSEWPKASVLSGGSPQQSLISLPYSLERLLLNNCNLECNNSILANLGVQSFLQYLNLGHNPFEVLPNYNHLKNLRVLDLTFCHKLRCLLCVPSTIEELYIYYCGSLEKITFESHRFALREIGIEGCYELFEIEGLFKLVPVEKLDETDLGHMKWIKKYQNCMVFLKGYFAGNRYYSHVQMLYEFGIMSTSLPRIEDPNVTSEYMSRSSFLSFSVPLHHENRKLQGLNVTFEYKRSQEIGFTMISCEDEYVWVRISNKTKGLNWLYNPMVFVSALSEEYSVWLSYWAIGNMLDTGDEVEVYIVGNKLKVSECGASLVYVDDEVEKESGSNSMESEEILGGDLSAFQLSTGAYYLCRRDFFELMDVDGEPPYWFRILFGDAIHYTELQGWRKTGRPQQLQPSSTDMKTFK